MAYGARAAVDRSKEVQEALSSFIGTEGFPLNISVQSHESQLLLTGMLHPDSITSDYLAALRCMSPEFHAYRLQEKEKHQAVFMGSDSFKAFSLTSNIVVLAQKGVSLPDWLFTDINDMSGVDGTPVSSLSLKDLEVSAVIWQMGLAMYQHALLKMLYGRLMLVDIVAMGENVFFSGANRECNTVIQNNEMIRMVVAPQEGVGYTLSMYVRRDHAVQNRTKVFIPVGTRVAYLNGMVCIHRFDLEMCKLNDFLVNTYPYAGTTKKRRRL